MIGQEKRPDFPERHPMITGLIFAAAIWVFILLMVILEAAIYG